MSQASYQQIIHQLNQAKHIAIYAVPDLTGDAFCAGLALNHWWQGQGKSSELLSTQTPSARFRFLPGFDLAKVERENIGGSVALNIKTDKKNLDEMWYEETTDGVVVHIEPASGTMYRREDVSVRINSTLPDLIITIGAQKLEDLGYLQSSDSEMFFKTPIINIDNSINNELFGEFNLIEIKTISLAEIIYNLISNSEGVVISRDSANCLLAGIMARTNSFRHVRTSPQIFAAASRLIEFGANQTGIVRHLFKEKPFNFLKLLGQAYSSLSLDEEIGLSVASLPGETDPSDFQEIFNELRMTLSDTWVILLISESKTMVSAREPLNPGLILDSYRYKLINSTQAELEIEPEATVGLINHISRSLSDWLKSHKPV